MGKLTIKYYKQPFSIALFVIVCSPEARFRHMESPHGLNIIGTEQGTEVVDSASASCALLPPVNLGQLQRPCGNETWQAGKSTRNGAFNRKITELKSVSSIAMFDYWRVVP